MGMKIIRGTAAHCLLAEESFRAEWSALAAQCPWATAFQSPAFAVDWYRTYVQQFQPIFILSRNIEGRLTGLLPLALCRAKGKLVAAGSHQAEYQAWLCLPESEESFPREAFDLVRREFPSASLQFRYVPAQVPLGWLSDSRQKKVTLLKACRRPLLTFGDGSEVEKSLRKSGNKNRLRQLKKIGPIEFKRVTDPAEFAELLDVMARYHDCRHLAVRGSAPFLTDRQKKRFHLAIMNEPGLLHITVLKVGDQIASAQLNMIRNKEVQLFLIAHNPTLAPFSPGKLHILFLAQLLKREGYEQLDLTPGGDAFKERFATAADQVHTLTIFPTPASRMRGMVGAAMQDTARVALKKLALEPARLRCFAREIRDIGALGLLKTIVGKARIMSHALTDKRVYRYAGADGDHGSRRS
jgi:CelD/BcsL family acetyltransferase involved in cellulose biosynthesis